MTTDATTPTTPDPQPEKQKHPKSDLNQADLKILSAAEQYALNLQNDPYKSKALEEDSQITDAWTVAYLKLIDDTRGGQQTHKEGRANVKGDTTAEAKVQTDLIELVDQIRGRAKTTFGRIAPEKLPLYGVGAKIHDSRAVLEGAADGIIKELGVDATLNISPAKVQKLKDLFAAYKGANVTQSDDNVEAKGQQIGVKANMPKVTAGRQKIQAAINGAFPYTDPVSGPHRTLFGLPPSQAWNPRVAGPA